MSSVEDLVRDVRRVLERFQANLKTSYERSVINLIVRLLECSYRCSRCCRDIPSISYSLLKLSLELIFQLRYFLEKYGTEKIEYFLKDLSRRSKRGSSFSIRMITDSRNIAGRVKREILNTYLQICEYVHPSLKLLMNPDISEYAKHMHKVVDIVMYTILMSYGTVNEICELCRRYSLERCEKYCSRK